MKRTLKVEVPEEWVALLETLGPVEDVLLQLLDHAQQGVYRPGAWERGWLEQAFGSDFQDGLEPDPAAPMFQRPRRR